MHFTRRFAMLRCLWLPLLTCFMLLCWAAPSLFVVKKVIALLMMPAGLAWVALMALAGWPGIGRWARALALAALVAHTLAGNVWLGGQKALWEYLGAATGG